MNLSLTRKRSLFSELKNDTYFRTFALIAGVIAITCHDTEHGIFIDKVKVSQ